MLFRPLCETFKTTFYYKRLKLIAINLCKHRIYVCKATIRDPYFLSVEQIVLSVCTQLCSCFCSECIRATVWFSKSIRTLPFTGCELRNIFLLLSVGSKI